MTFGWQAPLRVRGVETPIADYPRFDNPFLQVPFGDLRYEVTHGDYRLLLDFADGTREASGPGS